MLISTAFLLWNLLWEFTKNLTKRLRGVCVCGIIRVTPPEMRRNMIIINIFSVIGTLVSIIDFIITLVQMRKKK